MFYQNFFNSNIFDFSLYSILYILSKKTFLFASKCFHVFELTIRGFPYLNFSTGHGCTLFACKRPPTRHNVV